MELRRGIIKAFDPASYTATVQIAGSLGNWLAGVPVAKHLAAGLLAPGSRCGLIFFDPANPQDACLAFVYEGAPGAWVSDGMLEGNHDASKHTNRTRSFYLPSTMFGALQTVTAGQYGPAQREAALLSFPGAGGIPGGGLTIETPGDWVPGTALTFYIDWAADTDADTNHACRWYVRIFSMADGTNIYTASDDALLGATIPVPSATVKTRKRSLVGSSSSGLGAGKSIRLNLIRADNEAADTMTGAALFFGMHIEYTADM